MAYVTHLKPDGTYQPLKAHEENVAALAGKFAEAFDAKAHGERTGLLHDIGKYSDNGQKRQRDPEPVSYTHLHLHSPLQHDLLSSTLEPPKRRNGNVHPRGEFLLTQTLLSAKFRDPVSYHLFVVNHS